MEKRYQHSRMDHPRYWKTKLVALLGVSLVILVATGTSAQAAQKTLLTMGTTGSSSGYYAASVGFSTAVHEQCPDIQVTVIETGGGVDNLKRMQKGECQLGIGTNSLDYDYYRGYGNIKPYKDLRVFAYYTDSVFHFIVSKKSGITDIQQLDGKKFSFGGVGTSTEILTRQMLAPFGIKPIPYPGDINDAQTAFGDRQIVGLIKWGKPPESYVQQAMTYMDMHVINLTDAQINKIHEVCPYMVKASVPAGVYSKIGAFNTVRGFSGILTSATLLPQEIGYKLFKAYMSPRGREIMDSAFKPGKGVDVLESTVVGATAPLHAGVVQYLKEKRVEVPDRLVPPEYKP